MAGYWQQKWAAETNPKKKAQLGAKFGFKEPAAPAVTPTPGVMPTPVMQPIGPSLGMNPQPQPIQIPKVPNPGMPNWGQAVGQILPELLGPIAPAPKMKYWEAKKAAKAQKNTAPKKTVGDAIGQVLGTLAGNPASAGIGKALGALQAPKVQQALAGRPAPSSYRIPKVR